MNFFRRIWEDFKAYRREEHRVAPKGARGRIYDKRKAASAGPVGDVSSWGTAELEMKIMRADGTVEYRNVPAKVERR